VKRTLLVLIIIFGVLLRIWASQPTWMNGDENYYINIYQNYVDRGELTPYMWRLGGDTNIIAGSGTGYGIFVLIGWMRIFGESLFGVRMLMVLAGLVTAWVYYLTAKKWWGSHEAGIAALVFGLVSTSPFYTLVGKMDAIGILSYSLLLLLHITAVRQEKNWPHFLVGAAAILTTEFHILGLMYVGALAVYYGFQYLQIVRRERKLVLNTYPMYFFLGAGLLGALYIIVHILPNPEAYFVIPSKCSICSENIFNTEVTRIKKLFEYRLFEEVLLICMIYYSIKNRFREKDQYFLVMFLGYIVTQTIISPPPYVQYSQHILPILSVGIGGAFENLILVVGSEKQQLLKKVLLFLSLVWLGSNFLFFLTDRIPYENMLLSEPLPEIQYIKENIPESTVVLSFSSTFFWFTDYRNFVSYDGAPDYNYYLYGETREQFWERSNPKVIFLPPRYFQRDESLQYFVDEKNFYQVTPDLWVDQELIPGK